jgi:hypothetical protein
VSWGCRPLRHHRKVTGFFLEYTSGIDTRVGNSHIRTQEFSLVMLAIRGMTCSSSQRRRSLPADTRITFVDGPWMGALQFCKEISLNIC